MRHFRDAKEIEAFMVEHFRRDCGWPVQQKTGVSFIRISHTTETGEDIATEINITQLAEALGRKLS